MPFVEVVSLGSSRQRAKVSATQLGRQTGTKKGQCISPHFFSRVLFTTNPLGLRQAAGQVSNAAPPLCRPETLAALWRWIKELDAALCDSEVTVVGLIQIPEIGLLGAELAGHGLSLTAR